jgi:hypothetical protein
MNRIYIFIMLFLCSLLGFAQDSILLGKKYREDQFYLSISYNILNDKPQDMVQKGLSIGIHSGFMRDLPISEDGKFSLGIGLGYAYDKYLSNLIIDPDLETFDIASPDYDKNKFETHAIELPFEFRLRTSSATEYKFWRIYLGGKIAYNFSSKSIYQDNFTTLKSIPVPKLNHWQYGPQLAIGYSTWNIYAYWNLKPVFEKSNNINGINPSDLKSWKVGLQFYVF